MHRMLVLIRCFYAIICLPLIVSASPQASGIADCKSVTSHSGFAEFTMPQEGGKHTLAIKAGASVKWTIRNNAYVPWIAILEGGSGTGPGTLTIQLEANPGNLCRLGELTIAGIVPVYGLPIKILQQGTPTVSRERQERSTSYVIDLKPFPDNQAQTPGKPAFKRPTKKP